MEALVTLQARFTKPGVGTRAVQSWENDDITDKGWDKYANRYIFNSFQRIYPLA